MKCTCRVDLTIKISEVLFYKLFVRGMLASHLGDISRADPERVDPDYGVDWEGPVPDIAGEDEVCVENIPMFLSLQAYEQLQETIDPLEEDNQYGVLIYQAVADFVADQL